MLAIGSCVAKTRVEAAYWRDSRSLFEHALAVTSRNFLAHGNLGLVLRQEGRSAEAMAQFSAALAVAPEYVEARNHLGLTQRDLGEPAKAVASFEEVLRRAPDFAPAHFNLGETLLTMGDERRALEEFTTTVRLAPDHAGAHLQLSRLLLQRGQAGCPETGARAKPRARARVTASARLPGGRPGRLGKPRRGGHVLSRSLAHAAGRRRRDLQPRDQPSGGSTVPRTWQRPCSRVQSAGGTKYQPPHRRSFARSVSSGSVVTDPTDGLMARSACGTWSIAAAWRISSSVTRHRQRTTSHARARSIRTSDDRGRPGRSIGGWCAPRQRRRRAAVEQLCAGDRERAPRARAARP